MSKINSTAKRRIYRRDGRVCAKCRATTNLTIDHVIPSSLGGVNEDDNLQVLCRKCNQNKGDKYGTIKFKLLKAFKLEEQP